MAPDRRRQELLAAAMQVFLRYGFRKTSMEQVARAAQVSRQALYLHFESKEELFQAALSQVLETSLCAATLHLANTELGLEQRLLRAFDECVGKFVGALEQGAQDLAEAASHLGKRMVLDHERAFIDAVTKTLRSAGVAAAYKSAGLNAPQLSRTLYATARGLKQHVASRAEFAEELQIAVRALCFPVGKHV